MSDPDRPRRAAVIEPHELEQLLRAAVHSVCHNLLPNGREECGYWRVGSIGGEPGQSLAVNLTGPNVGLWTDFSAPDSTPERSGDMLWLAARVRYAGKLADAITWGISFLGLDGLDPNRLRTEKAKARKAANDAATDAARLAERNRRSAMQLYLSGAPIAGTIAETYLISRGIDLRAHGLVAPGSLKFNGEVYCKEAQRRLPCLVAAMVNVSGHHVASHRTWLREDGKGKAALIEPKKALGKFRGGFIPLWKGRHDVPMKDIPQGTPVLVSEGIEDGLSAALACPEERVIAAVALDNMGALELPPQMGPLIILAQHDDVGSKAVQSLERVVAKHQAQGRDVRLAFPPAGVKDLNELLCSPDGAIGDLLGEER